jgi:hypothetical protein
MLAPRPPCLGEALFFGATSAGRMTDMGDPEWQDKTCSRKRVGR